MLIQLNPVIPLITPKGKGDAHFLLDYSQEHTLLWIVFIEETGECWTFENEKIRLQTNLTFQRDKTSEIE